MQAGAVSTLSLIFTVIGSFSLKHNIMTANAQKLADHQITASQISSTATGLIVYTIVIGLVSIGLWLWMARMNEAGRRWARITASVFFALWSLYTYSVIGELHGGVTVTATLIVSLILILALWVIGAATVFYLGVPPSPPTSRPSPRKPSPADVFPEVSLVADVVLGCSARSALGS